MFCDLVGSTAVSARLDPEDLKATIGAYRHCCTELVERNGGFAAKYMDDGVLGYFGYSKAPKRTCMMPSAPSEPGLPSPRRSRSSPLVPASPLQARVGIASGLVGVGDLIGSGTAQEQAVVGETPNLAARLQVLAEPGGAVVAASTHSLIGGLFEYRDLGTLALKGFAENVSAWQVLRASAAESRFETLRVTKLRPRWSAATRRSNC
jgi:class 3 adenylate cyclase